MVPLFGRRLCLFLIVGTTAAVATPSSPYPNCTDRPPRQSQYMVEVVDRTANSRHGGSLISHVNGTSDYEFNFAAAWFPSNSNGAATEGLVVRIVDYAQHPDWSNAGALVVVPARLNEAQPPLWAAHVTQADVTWAGSGFGSAASNIPQWGAADPRITYRPANQLYYLTWDNCTKNCWPQRVTYLSTSPNPFDPTAWTFHGQVFPWKYTSGASLLFREDDVDNFSHLAFVCNSNTADKIFVAESTDGLHWKIPDNPHRRLFMAGRPGCWDAKGVAAGAQPEKLNTGDYLYIYNIDTGWPYKPNPLGRCSIGWAILDGRDPTKIVARADQALLIPELPWETCAEGPSKTCQVPMVVFTTGLKPIRRGVETKKGVVDEFYVLYGGADSDVGITKIQVTSLRDGGGKYQYSTEN